MWVSVLIEIVMMVIKALIARKSPQAVAMQTALDTAKVAYNHGGDAGPLRMLVKEALEHLRAK